MDRLVNRRVARMEAQAEAVGAAPPAPGGITPKGEPDRAMRVFRLKCQRYRKLQWLRMQRGK
jgi:hypothetical protein